MRKIELVARAEPSTVYIFTSLTSKRAQREKNATLPRPQKNSKRQKKSFRTKKLAFAGLLVAEHISSKPAGPYIARTSRLHRALLTILNLEQFSARNYKLCSLKLT